jgi:structural maintenance of chromosome 4
MPDLEVLNEWKEREKQFLQRADELAQATEMRDNMKNEYERLRSLRLVEFMSGFSTISLKLKEMYQVRFISHLLSHNFY